MVSTVVARAEQRAVSAGRSMSSRSPPPAAAATRRAASHARARAPRRARRRPPRSPTRAPTGPGDAARSRSAQRRPRRSVRGAARAACARSLRCASPPTEPYTLAAVTRLAGAESGTLSLLARDLLLRHRRIAMVGLSAEPVSAELPRRGPHARLRLRGDAGEPDRDEVLGRGPPCRRSPTSRGRSRSSTSSGGPRRSRRSSTRRSRSGRRRSGSSSACATEAAARAPAPPGIVVVQDRCIKMEHCRWFGGLNWVGLSTGVISSRREETARADRPRRVRLRHARRCMPASASMRRPAPAPCRSTRRRRTCSRTPQHAADLFDLNRFGNIYTRIMNPTTAAFEERDGGARGRRRRAGGGSRAWRRSAIAIADAARGRATRSSSSQNLYGGTLQPARRQLPRASASRRRFVDPDDLDAVRARDHAARTTLLYAETIGNPRIDVLDIAGWRADRARRRPAARDRQHLRHAVPVPPVRARRRTSWCHSATKFIGGHGTSIGGVIVDCGALRLGRRALPRRDRAVARATAACASTRRSATSPSS